VESIERNLERAKKGEREALFRAHKSVKELAGTLNQLGVTQRPARIEHIITTLRPVAPDNYRSMIDELESEYRKTPGDLAALERVEDALDKMESDIRGDIWDDVLLDLRLLSGQRVNARQAELFKAADKLTDDVLAAGGYRAATEPQLRELRRLHAELLAVHPELAEKRANARQEEVRVLRERRPDSHVEVQ
jgi:hypothetical protein